MVLEILQQYIMSYPKTSIICLAAVVSFFIALVNYLIINKEKMHTLKERQKQIQEEMKTHKDNPQKLMELQKEMFSHVGETFKHSLLPMAITFIPLLLFFNFLRTSFATTAIAHTWFWYYLITSIAASMIFRKIFKMP